MTSTLTTVLPIFALVALGYVLGRTPVFPSSGTVALTTFTTNIAVPALLFRAMATVESGGGGLAVLLAYFGGAFIVFALGFLGGRTAWRLPREEAAVMAMGSSFGNSILLGVPLAVSAFGDGALLPLTLIVSVHSLIMFTLTAFIIETARDAGTGRARLLAISLGGTLRNPIVLSMVLGMAYGQLGVPLPAPVEAFLRLLGAAAAPCALFAVGASLAGFGIAGSIGQALAVTALKLLLLPAVVFGIAHHVLRLDPLSADVATLVAALPTGANVFLLAQQYGVYVRRASSAVLISTGLSVPTIAIVLALLGAVK